MTTPSVGAFTAVQAKFQEAFACHQKGQNDAARRLYEDVLALAPQHFDALHFSGVLAAQAGAYDQAVDLIGRALALNPTHASARYNLGLALGGLKRHAEALDAYDQTLALIPTMLARITIAARSCVCLGAWKKRWRLRIGRARSIPIILTG